MERESTQFCEENCTTTSGAKSDLDMFFYNELDTINNNVNIYFYSKQGICSCSVLCCAVLGVAPCTLTGHGSGESLQLCPYTMASKSLVVGLGGLGVTCSP